MCNGLSPDKEAQGMDDFPSKIGYKSMSTCHEVEKGKKKYRSLSCIRLKNDEYGTLQSTSSKRTNPKPVARFLWQAFLHFVCILSPDRPTT
jgi:hypothetical protein